MGTEEVLDSGRGIQVARRPLPASPGPLELAGDGDGAWLLRVTSLLHRAATTGVCFHKGNWSPSRESSLILFAGAHWREGSSRSREPPPPREVGGRGAGWAEPSGTFIRAARGRSPLSPGLLSSSVRARLSQSRSPLC